MSKNVLYIREMSTLVIIKLNLHCTYIVCGINDLPYDKYKWQKQKIDQIVLFNKNVFIKYHCSTTYISFDSQTFSLKYLYDKAHLGLKMSTEWVEHDDT